MKTNTQRHPLNLSLSLSLILFLGLNLIKAQKDPEAVEVLSEFSRKATSAPSVSISFNIITNDAREGSITTAEGSAVISGDKYRLTLSDNSIWADGKTVWNYLPDVNEVTITGSDPEDQSFLSKPSLLFSMYEEGYKIKLVDQSSAEWIIDLYPEDISGNLMRIRLKIGKQNYFMKSAEYKTKDGITVILNVGKYDLSFRPGVNYFKFDPSAYKDIEVVDMR